MYLIYKDPVSIVDLVLYIYFFQISQSLAFIILFRIFSEQICRKYTFGHKSTISWLVVLGFNATLTAKVMSWRSATFLTCFCRGERRTYAGKKSRLNPGSNSQPPGYESDTLTTEPPGRGSTISKIYKKI